MAYLARLRAEYAADLLLNSDEPIACIARAVGWPDQTYFARRFLAHYGLSATAYRAKFSAHSARPRCMPATQQPPATVGSRSHGEPLLPAHVQASDLHSELLSVAARNNAEYG